MAEEIVLRVQNEVVGLETREIKPQQTVNKKPETQKETEDRLKSQAKDNFSKLIAIQMGKKALNYALQNYGNLTGNHIAQQQLNDKLELFGMGAMVLTGPLGATAVGTQVVITGANRLIEVDKSRSASKVMQTRLGITNGGSR